MGAVMATSSKRTTSRSKDLSSPGSPRTGASVADLKQSFVDHLVCGLGRPPIAATRNDAYTALALAIRDRVFAQGVRTTETDAEQNARVVAYLSAEFLPGPHLEINLLSLGLLDT